MTTIHPADTSLLYSYPVHDESLQTNLIKTSHYTVWNFVPMCLFEQFHRLANLFFLLCAILQAIPVVSPLNPVMGFFSLIFMLAISMVKVGYEDYKRHKADDAINSKISKIWTPTGIIKKQWQDIRIGDIIVVEVDEEFPADCILVDVSSIDGRCRIETSALDGETNLKFKNSVKESQIHTKVFQIEISPPIQDLTVFAGSITTADGNKIPVGLESFVARGCFLRKTEQVLAFVTYIGETTKIIMNSAKPRYKYTEIDRFMSKFVVIMFIILLSFAVGLTLGSYFWTQSKVKEKYLRFENLPKITYVQNIFTWILIVNQMIPLCAYSSLDLVRFFLSIMISSDPKMADGKDHKSKCRNSDLVSTIGRISHIFSDKTGTLTKNKMTFKACGFMSCTIGLMNDKNDINRKEEEDDFSDSEEEDMSSIPSDSENEEKMISLDKASIEWIKKHSETDLDVQIFLLTICLCNSAVTAVNTRSYPIEEIKEQFPDYNYTFQLPPTEVVTQFPYTISYQTSSPDEIALLHLARECGYVLYSVDQTAVVIIINGVVTEFSRPINFEFTSKRRRGTCLVLYEGKQYLFMKGADSVVLERATCDPILLTRLQDISENGLRTLLFAYKEVDNYEKIQEEYTRIKNMTVGFEEEMERLQDETERGLKTIGISGVEDELQNDVQITLTRLRNANINVWMLTGDKLDTAMNIAATSGLVLPQHHIINVTIDDGDEHFESLKNENFSNSAIALEGSTLKKFIQDPELCKEFFEITTQCFAVICARCEPSNKGNCVRAFKKVNPKAMVLSIGDGANDVDMIRAADVGIGVEGKEGSDAVMSSDFSIPSFRHLARLLIVHGRWCANRSALLINLTFYKNDMIAYQQILYGIFNGYSATSIFDSAFLSLYNICLTIPQLFFICIFEEDVDSRFALAVPQVYIETQKNGGLGFSAMFEFKLLAVIHSLLIFFYSYFESNSVLLGNDATTFDLVVFTQITGWNLLFVFTVELLMRFKTMSVVHVLLYICCIIVYGLIEFIYSYFDPMFYNIISIIFTLPRIWLSLPFIVCTCMLIDLILIYIRPVCFPSLSTAVAELEYAGRL